MHGSVCSFTGPVIDLRTYSLYFQTEKAVFNPIKPFINIHREVFLPSVQY